MFKFWTPLARKYIKRTSRILIFGLNGYVNIQICQFLASGINGTYFFKDAANQTVMLSDHVERIVFKEIENKDIDNILLQHDGATCHTAETILDFEKKII